METRRILLRPVGEKDIIKIFSWRNKDKFRNFFHYKSSIIDYENFVTEFKKDSSTRHTQLVIESKSDKEIIGLIFSFNLNLIDGYCFINVYLDEKFEQKGYGPEAFGLLFCHLFDSYPLNKIYTEVFDYNKLSLSTITSTGFKEEGRFKEHKFYNGKRHDVIRFAAYCDSLPRFRKIIEHYSKQLK